LLFLFAVVPLVLTFGHEKFPFRQKSPK
jgi:hypothetical protein